MDRKRLEEILQRDVSHFVKKRGIIKKCVEIVLYSGSNFYQLGEKTTLTYFEKIKSDYPHTGIQIRSNDEEVFLTRSSPFIINKTPFPHVDFEGTIVAIEKYAPGPWQNELDRAYKKMEKKIEKSTLDWYKLFFPTLKL